MTDQTREELIAEARKASRAVYLATDEPVADDLSRILKALADALLRSATETREAQAEAWDEAIKASGDVVAEQGYLITAKRLTGVYESVSTPPYPMHPPVNPYRSVAVVPEDPKPLDPNVRLHHNPSLVGQGCYWCGGYQGRHVAAKHPRLGYDPDPARYGVTPTPEVEEDDRYISRFRENPNSTGGFRD